MRGIVAFGFVALFATLLPQAVPSPRWPDDASIVDSLTNSSAWTVLEADLATILNAVKVFVNDVLKAPVAAPGKTKDELDAILQGLKTGLINLLKKIVTALENLLANLKNAGDDLIALIGSIIQLVKDIIKEVEKLFAATTKQAVDDSLASLKGLLTKLGELLTKLVNSDILKKLPTDITGALSNAVTSLGELLKLQISIQVGA